MIEKIDIKDASIAEEIRKQMAGATAKEKGLLSNTMFSTLSMLTNGYNPAKTMPVTTDINKLYLECDAGLTFYTMISVAINVPGAGFLLHFQRLSKGNITAGSFLVSQLSILVSGEILYRYGLNVNENVVYSQWRKI